MYRIGVISDTHNVLREEVLDILKDCDYILHAGDIMQEDILDRLKALTQVIAVKGNNDQLDLDDEIFFSIGGFRFYMTHQIKEWQDTDFYIYGHSHRYECYQKEGIQYLNPGSCGRKRFSLPLTYALIDIDGDRYTITQMRL
ncbi:metallophosphoesterase family protein [Candidatus Stoquefichus sp. SB1]|uniref:metallophosphoesterase family protein n=1 Tax=Candidatus Stoquefichus sp. SB1 TaxID=1658109 RepID=UPI00067EB72B|nr:metallophosphoesterase family protein [Candidatus Stoquefichus sp. SB1]